MHVATADVQSNPNIGLFACATDEVCIIGPEAAPLKELLQEVLQVPIIQTTIAGTSMAGVFLVGTGKTFIVPNIVFEHEIAVLEKAGLKVLVFDTKHTALGNNIVLSEAGGIAGPMFSQQELTQLNELTGKDFNQFSIAHIEVIGSSIVHTSQGTLIHRDASDSEAQMVADTLGATHVQHGSVNLGVPYVRSGIIANQNGFLIGASSGGPEITNADEALGFLKDE